MDKGTLRYAWRIGALILVLAFTQLVQAAGGDPQWIQLSPAGGPPGPRIDHVAVYDPGTNRMIVSMGLNQAYGAPCTTQFGNYGQFCYNDVWVLSNADGLGGSSVWTQLTPSGTPPAPRFGATAVYDPGSNRMILFDGGSDAFPYPYSFGCTGLFGEVWVLTNANGSGGSPAWTQLSPLGSPPPRRSHVAVYDTANNRMITFGGDVPCAYGNDVWVLSNANGLGGPPTWTQLSPAGSLPPARGEFPFGGAYDVGNNRLIIFGGASSSGNLHDVWVLSNANGLGGTPTWTQLSPAGTLPGARNAHTVVYDSGTNSITIVGGADAAGNVLSDVWRLSNANGLGGAPAWTQLTPTGGPLGPRAGHSAVYHQATKREIIFGGLASHCVSASTCAGKNDTWVLSDVILFAAFSAKMDINVASSSFDTTGTFTLGSGGSINPQTQAVTVQVGTYTTTIPAGSFTQNKQGFAYQGVINGVALQMTINLQSGSTYAVKLQAAGVVPATTNPVPVSFTIGNNTGSISVNAQIQ